MSFRLGHIYHELDEIDEEQEGRGLGMLVVQGSKHKFQLPLRIMESFKGVEVGVDQGRILVGVVEVEVLVHQVV